MLNLEIKIRNKIIFFLFYIIHSPNKIYEKFEYNNSHLYIKFPIQTSKNHKKISKRKNNRYVKQSKILNKYISIFFYITFEMCKKFVLIFFRIRHIHVYFFNNFRKLRKKCFLFI